MADVTLRNVEAAILYEQLKGLAAHQLPGDIKFKIYENANALEKVHQSYNASKRDLLIQFAEPFKGNYFIKQFIGENLDIINPKFEQYHKELEALDSIAVSYSMYILPATIFTSEREFIGEMDMIYKYVIERKPAIKDEI